MINLAENYFNLKEQFFNIEYAHLNSKQRQAVFTVNDPLLILAGAGSGKTTVLVNKISHILKYGDSLNSYFIPTYLTEENLKELDEICKKAQISGYKSLNEEEKYKCEKYYSFKTCRPWNILAITFTNKAAKELKDRISLTVGEKGDEVWACTFHYACLRFLRGNSSYLGYEKSITIYDMDDQLRLIKKAYEALQIDDKKFPHKMILSSIGRLKDQLLSPAEALEQASDFYSKIVANVYEQYQKSLYTSCAMDFDDIIMQTVKLFTEYPHILQKYQSQFKYILVDEYQDTNKAQFVLVSLLAAKPEGENRNICVVGDDDQSIYKFRGATVENILNFEDVFDNATVIKLEENYRCTQPILDAANSVIANNTQRKEKSLWTSKDIGEKVLFIKTQDEIAEAEIITGLIKQNFKNGGKYSDNAILYRMNAQSNTIEKTFARRGIPYKIFGGLRFYDRKEIKDMLAYLWLIVNPDDNIRLLRVINEPKRGIGQTTIDKITQIATENNLSVFNVIKHASSYSEIESRKKLFDPFVNLIENLQKVYLSTPLDQLYDKLLEDSGYANSLLLHGEEGETRLGNIKELKTNILEYLKKEETKINNTIEVDEEYESFSMDKKSSDNILESFLSEVSLATELDNYDEKQDYVSMMTIHSAKGLEFKNIFLPAIEETIFPSTRSVQENDIEEERRLAYVAITRAKENLYIINARKRIFYGKTSFNEPSRFINEINPDVIEIFDQTKLIQDENLIRNELKPFIIDHSVKDLNKYASKSYYPQKNSSSSGFSVGKSSSQTKPKPTFGTHNVVAGAKQTEKKIFLPGDGIEHKKFGNGIVKMAKPMGNDTLIEVEFADGTIKKIMANLAPIEKI